MNNTLRYPGGMLGCIPHSSVPGRHAWCVLTTLRYPGGMPGVYIPSFYGTREACLVCIYPYSTREACLVCIYPLQYPGGMPGVYMPPLLCSPGTMVGIYLSSLCSPGTMVGIPYLPICPGIPPWVYHQLIPAGRCYVCCSVGTLV